MKKFLLLVCLGAMAFGGAAAQAQRYTIRGKAPASENGKTVYLSAYGESRPLDSAVVRNGKFVFRRSDSGIRRLDLGEEYYTNLIAEPGKIRVDLSDPDAVSGTPLNDSLVMLSKELQRLSAEMDRVWADSVLTREEKKQRAGMFFDCYRDMPREAYRANADNAFGVWALWDASHLMSPEEFLAVMDSGALIVKEFFPLKQLRRQAERQLATAERKPFVDFEGRDSTGRAVRLSDYVGRGKYVLVDFWASWCGPCRQETPLVAKVYEKYRDKGLEVLGLFVWDQPKNLDKAVKDLKIAWPQLIDSDGVAGKLYGVSGIPHIMLFGPDGTILARGLRGERIEEAIARYLK